MESRRLRGSLLQAAEISHQTFEHDETTPLFVLVGVWDHDALYWRLGDDRLFTLRTLLADRHTLHQLADRAMRKDQVIDLGATQRRPSAKFIIGGQTDVSRRAGRARRYRSAFGQCDECHGLLRFRVGLRCHRQHD